MFLGMEFIIFLEGFQFHLSTQFNFDQHFKAIFFGNFKLWILGPLELNI